MEYKANNHLLIQMTRQTITSTASWMYTLSLLSFASEEIAYQACLGSDSLPIISINGDYLLTKLCLVSLEGKKFGDFLGGFEAEGHK